VKLTQYNVVYTGVTAIGVSANPTVVGSAAANVAVVPLSTRSNPINVWGQVIDGGASTYAVQYTTADVYAPGFNPATSSNWIAIPSAPTGGTGPFNLTALGATGIRLNVTVGPATVTLGPVFQSDSTLGA
jgi:hypothetical protein